MVANHWRPQQMCSHESHNQCSEEQEQARWRVNLEDGGNSLNEVLLLAVRFAVLPKGPGGRVSVEKSFQQQ